MRFFKSRKDKEDMAAIAKIREVFGADSPEVIVQQLVHEQTRLQSAPRPEPQKPACTYLIVYRYTWSDYANGDAVGEAWGNTVIDHSGPISNHNDICGVSNWIVDHNPRLFSDKPWFKVLITGIFRLGA